MKILISFLLIFAALLPSQLRAQEKGQNITELAPDTELSQDQDTEAGKIDLDEEEILKLMSEDELDEQDELEEEDDNDLDELDDEDEFEDDEDLDDDEDLEEELGLDFDDDDEFFEEDLIE